MASATVKLPVALNAEDRRILCAAIQTRCDYLLTGDKKDLGHLFGRAIGGVVIVTPMRFAEELESQEIVELRKEP